MLITWGISKVINIVCGNKCVKLLWIVDIIKPANLQYLDYLLTAYTQDIVIIELCYPQVIHILWITLSI